MTNRYTRRSINLDDTSHDRCKLLAENMAISISGLLRIIIKQAYERHLSYEEHYRKGPPSRT
jgi:hypothetical protein